jgi:hypothetical protein
LKPSEANKYPCLLSSQYSIPVYSEQLFVGRVAIDVRAFATVFLCNCVPILTYGK